MKMSIKNISKIFALSIIMIMFFNLSFSFGFSKNETVFMELDKNGNTKNSVVNNHLKLSDKEKNSKLEDNSELEEIININGEEGFSLNGNLLQWETLSKDIYYQGTAKNIVPIGIDIKYFLNEEEKSIEEIEGKSGEVTIELKFTNNLKHGKLYTPFIVMCGTMISDDGNSEINVTNGKVVDTGTKSFAAAIASPGLYESIGLKEFENLDMIKISYKTEKFDKDVSIYIAATPKLIEEKDLEVFNKMDNLAKNINILQKNMNTIEKGANDLKNGAKELENGAKTLAVGANTVNDGVKSVANGATTLKFGTESLASGANNLKDGAATVATGISTISEKLKEVVSGVNELETGSKSLDEGLEQILSSVEDAKEMFTSKETVQSMQILNNLKNQNASAAKEIKTAYKKYNLSELTIDEIIENPGFTNAQKANLITVKNNFENNNGGLIKLLDGNAAAIDGMMKKLETVQTKLNELEAALKQAKAGSSMVSGGLTNLKNGIIQIYGGTTKISGGAEALKNGASTLSSGANELSKGAFTLANGSNKLESGATDLAKGARTLSDGSSELSSGTSELASGIAKFNKEGINKLTNYGNKLSDYSDTVRELINLSNEYSGFSCNNANVTNFVYVVK